MGYVGAELLTHLPNFVIGVGRPVGTESQLEHTASPSTTGAFVVELEDMNRNAAGAQQFGLSAGDQVFASGPAVTIMKNQHSHVRK